MFTIDGNLIEKYLQFNKGTEPPLIYHRWCMLGAISSMLRRNAYIRHGHKKIFANNYIMLIGESGARKSTAIKLAVKILQAAGYDTLAGDKTSKEKFLLDLARGMNLEDDDPLDVSAEIAATKGRRSNKPNHELDTDLTFMGEFFGKEGKMLDASNCLIPADEFNVFLGHGNMEFIDLLTTLWDYDGEYKNRTKTSKSFSIWNPTINILGGNNYYGLTMAFPTEVIGTGFFSRLLLVYSDPTGRKITWPKVTEDAEIVAFATQLLEIAAKCTGEFTFTNEARSMIGEIYHGWTELEDHRFKSYSSRRLDHLFKVCMSVAASGVSTEINAETVLYANSMLSYAEVFMPKALGEFGASRNSKIVAKISSLLESTGTGHTFQQVLAHVGRDVDTRKQLLETLQSMHEAGKINLQSGLFLPKKKPVVPHGPYVNFELLQEFMEKESEN